MKKETEEEVKGALILCQKNRAIYLWKQVLRNLVESRRRKYASDHSETENIRGILAY